MNKMGKFKICSFDSEKLHWIQSSPYAILFLISCLGEVTSSRITYFINRYTTLDLNTSRSFSEAIIKELLCSGNIYESKGGFFSILPPYCVQKGIEDWVVLGDARIDQILSSNALAFEITSRANISGEIFLERMLLSTKDDAINLFKILGIRLFQNHELLNLVPDIEGLQIPIPWPGYDPGSYSRWEVLNENGVWEEIEYSVNFKPGIYKGVNTDRSGKVVFEKYFYKHKNGWSPITSDEANLWLFRLAYQANKSYCSYYSTAEAKLKLPFRVPYSAYVALQYLGQKRNILNNQIIVEGIDYQSASIICQKLKIHMQLEGDQKCV